ncbi:MAG TPA: hypothetical protein PK629_05395 [Oscillospiraceae bacterium]|nr:hypothetical protein [Oscillospiraceae bacterium]HPF56712.1 hypothetical protein [Clostridiales bacterium]HPK35738.1 hypothetical protein [Oscillospiraceae bacterium]HPR75054.1 hypothetical protein [Oscillospiraceae bacterium]
MSEISESAFAEKLNQLHESYDEKEHMLLLPFRTPGYHTTLKGGVVHPTIHALNYAVALLDSKDKKNTQRASRILRKVISLQDTDPSHNTYGIWPWFLEEPLSQMSPPDWNWADFCGKQLLQAAIDYTDVLEPDLQELLKAAIIHACKSIMKRDVGPDYTNISLKGTYVTYVAGKHFNEPEILAYAKNRLKILYAYNMENGAFNEYNSPTYTVVAIEEIASMLLHIRDQDALDKIRDLNKMAWGCLAQHFHMPTRQWAGPHYRCYTNLLPKNTLSFIQIGTGGKVRFLTEDDLDVSPSWVRMKLECPEEFYDYFLHPSDERIVSKTFHKGTGTAPDEKEYGYYNNDYVLSSFNRSVFWNQRRPLLAYMSTPEAPVYMQLRLLHDGYDYASGHLTCVQKKGAVLGMVNFFTDGGDTHLHLDRIQNSTITAADLRLRLEFGGAVESVKSVMQTGDAAFEIHTNDLVISINCIEAAFDNNIIRLEQGKDEEKRWVDFILYAGVKRIFRLDAIEKAYAIFTLNIGRKKIIEAGGKETHAEPIPGAFSVQCGDGLVTVTGKLGEENDRESEKITMTVPAGPLPYLKMVAAIKKTP